MINTIKTTWGYLLFKAGKYIPIKLKGDAVEDIYNYLPINNVVATSGRPTRAQFHSIRDAGYQTVINLLPDKVENAMDNEAGLVRELGMDYVHIPVNFRAPTAEDFKKFSAAMEKAAGKKVWVHCAANARASAFMYRYRCQKLGENPEQVKWDVREIWEPFGVWKTFMGW